MRIAFLSAEYPPDTDGIGAYVSSIAPALVEAGHEVHVLSCVPGQASADEIDRGVHVHRRPRPGVRGLARLLRSPVAAERIAQALACRRELRGLGLPFTVVEAPDYLAEGLLITRPQVAHLHTPVLLVVRHNGLEMDWNNRAGDWLERIAVRRAAAVTAPSSMLVASLREARWLAAGRDVTVVPYPIDLEAWSSVAPVGETAPTVMLVGRLEHRKAPDILVEACARLGASSQVEALLVGRSDGERDGLPYGEWVRRLAADRGVRATFVDHVPRHELVQWYGRARVVAVISRYDNYPMVTLEGLAAGRPVVCSDAVGSADLVSGTGAGAVVPVGDPDALAEALRPYLADAATAAAAGDRAREVARRECSQERVAQRRLEIYREAQAR